MGLGLKEEGWKEVRGRDIVTEEVRWGGGACGEAFGDEGELEDGSFRLF